MKSLVLIASFISAIASAQVNETPVGDVPTPDQVIQSVTFKGAPNRTVMASIIDPQDGTDLDLWITHQRPNDIRYFSVASNNKLGLVHGGLSGTESTLEVSKGNSLQIHQQNLTVGRGRWQRILTVNYRDGGYVISGFTYNFYDTLLQEPEQNCDYNLLTGRGTNNGRAVKIKTGPIAFERASDSMRKLSSCVGW